MSTLSLSRPQTKHLLLLAASWLFVLALYINLSKIILGSRYFMLLGDAFLLLLFLAGTVVYLRRSLPITPLELLVMLFVSMGVAQLFNPNVPSVLIGLEGFRRLMFQMLGLLLGMAVIRKREDVAHLWKIIALCAVPILLYAIKQFFVISDFDQAIIDSNTADLDTWRIFGKIRAFGFFNGPFHLGIFSGIVFWVAISLRMVTRQKRYTLIAALAVLACVASLTRTNILALLASMPIASFLVLRGSRVKVLLVTAAVLVAAAVVFAIAYWTIPEVSMALEGYSAVESLQDDGRLQGRFDDYHNAVNMLAEYPLGAGMSSAGDATGPDFESKGRLHITSHNMLLWVAVETGLPGLLIFLAILGYLVHSIYRLVRKSETALALAGCGSLVVIMISGLTGSTLSAYPVNLIFWTLAGCYLGFLRQPGLAVGEHNP